MGRGISENLGPQGHATSSEDTSVEDIGSLYIPKEPMKGMSLVCVVLSLHLPIPLHADQQPGSSVLWLTKEGPPPASSLNL